MEQRTETARERDELLQQVTDLLRKYKLGEGEGSREEPPRPEHVQDLVRRRDFAELQHELERVHPADVAYILEALPLEQRLIVWDLVKAERDGEILLEVSDAVRETLIEHMDERELVA